MAVINGIDVEIRRKRIKNVHLYVKPDGSVLLTAPLRTSDERIASFIASRSEWIVGHQKRFAASVPLPRYEDGETVPILGLPFTLRISEGKGYSATVDGNEIRMTVREGCTREQMENFIRKWQRGILADAISELLPRWESATGMRCSGWQIKNMRTRWGTCNTSTHKLWFSLKLAEKPLECIEYVILHELTHTVVRNHGDDFIAVLNRFMPDWERRKKAMNMPFRSDE